MERNTLIGHMIENPNSIETRNYGPWDLWVFVPRQIDVDDWDESDGLAMTVNEFEDLMDRYAGLEEPEEEEN